MARSPDWITLTPNGIRQHAYAGHEWSEAMFRARVRPWHPSFWPVLWRVLDVRPRLAKPFVWVWAMARLLR